MATLYEIDEAMLQCIDLETGEIVDFEKLNQLQMERDEKIEKVALWYKNLLSDAEAFKVEKNNFADKEKSAKNKAESLKKYLDYALQGEKFKTTRVNVTYRKSQSVECEDINRVPKDYLRYKDPELDRTAVRQAFKEGTEVPGCSLMEKQNIQIK